MGIVDEIDWGTEECPHCKKEIKIVVQFKGDGLSWVGLEKE